MTKLPYRIRRWDAIALAGLFWCAVTGFVIEKVISDGVQSWTLVLCVPLITLAIGLLLHEAIASRNIIAGVLGLVAMGVTLPAAIGSTGAASDKHLASTTAANRGFELASADLAEANKSLSWAQREMARECGTGEGVRCKGWRSTVRAYELRKQEVVNQLSRETPRPTLSGESRLAWAASLFGLNVQASDIQRGWPILPPVIVELLFAFWLHMGLDKRRQDETNQDTSEWFRDDKDASDDPSEGGGWPPRGKADVLADIQRRIAIGERWNSQDELRADYRLPKSTMSQWLQEWEALGEVPKRNISGRCKSLAS